MTEENGWRRVWPNGPGGTFSLEAHRHLSSARTARVVHNAGGAFMAVVNGEVIGEFMFLDDAIAAVMLVGGR